MNPQEYVLMRGQEDTHWWYRALRAAVVRHLRLRLPQGTRPARIVDAGCGTGGMLAALRENFAGALLIGVDLEEQAVRISAGLGVADHVLRASINALPLGSARFDAVISLDVLYHADVDEAAALAELKRVLRPGGPLIVNLPAFEALRGAHDVAVHGARRYTPRRLAALAAAEGLEVEHWTCWNTTLLPLVWAWRTFGRLAGSEASDLRPAPAWVNTTLGALIGAEWRIADRARLPLGSSLFAILRKPALA